MHRTLRSIGSCAPGTAGGPFLPHDEEVLDTRETYDWVLCTILDGVPSATPLSPRASLLGLRLAITKESSGALRPTISVITLLTA